MVGTKRNLADMIRDSGEQVFMKICQQHVGLRSLFSGCRTQSTETTVKIATGYANDIADIWADFHEPTVPGFGGVGSHISYSISSQPE